MKKLLASGLLLATLILSACAPSSNSSNKINVVASFYPIEFLAQQIAGDHINLTTLVPSGVEPHDYELTPQNVATIETSQLLVVNGIVEPWFADTKTNLEKSDVAILNLSEKMNLLNSSDSEISGKDPHVWLDPTLMAQMAGLIRDALAAADPANATAYEANTLTLEQKLTDLDKEYRTGLAHCDQKNIVTSHAAFAYLAQAYGLTQMPISGLSPDSEPSAQKIKEIVDFVRANKVSVIFFESLVNPNLSNTIATEVGAKTMVLNPIEGLTAAQEQAGADYFSIMEDNLQTLKTALSCQ